MFPRQQVSATTIVTQGIEPGLGRRGGGGRALWQGALRSEDSYGLNFHHC